MRFGCQNYIRVTAAKRLLNSRMSVSVCYSVLILVRNGYKLNEIGIRCQASPHRRTTLESIRLETSIKDVDGLKVIDATGEIDVYTAPQFKEAVNQVISLGQLHLIINMTQVTYMDSSGFGTLLSATKRLRPEGGTINLVACSNSIDRMLRITRLNTVFGIYGTVEEAIAAVGKGTKQP
jgi:anti-sigma B factor antagonist